jgi:hypothetical protein
LIPFVSHSEQPPVLRAEDPPDRAPADDAFEDEASTGVAAALRGARARTGMSEAQVVAKLSETGFRITTTRLRIWERTGVIRVDAASHLADAYGTTIDALAGRRAYRPRHPAQELPNLGTGL